MYICKRNNEYELKTKLRTAKLMILDFDGIIFNLSQNYNSIEARRKLVELMIKHSFPVKKLVRSIDPFDILCMIDKERDSELYEKVSKILKSYEITALLKSRSIPYISELLMLLVKRDVSFCIVSLQPTDIIRHALSICSPGLVVPIFGRDSASRPKPWPDHLIACMSVNGCNTDYSIMIGDGLTDALAAKRAGISFIGIELGLFTRYELCEYGALAVFKDIGEFLRYLRRIYSS